MSTYHLNLSQLIRRPKYLLSVISLLILILLLNAPVPKAATSKQTSTLDGSGRGLADGLRAARGFRAGAIRRSAEPIQADDKFTFGPSQVTPGSVRQFTVTISEAQCQNNKFESSAAVITADALKALKDNNKFDISNPVLSPDRCTYSAVLKVGSDAPFDKVAVTLNYKETLADGSAAPKSDSAPS